MGWSRLVPIVEWLPRYRRADLRYDVIAGITVSALVVPKALGYAGIAQVPVENGLYAAAAGALVYAIFGTSRQISTGPSSALAAVAAGAVAVAGVAAGEATAELVAADHDRHRGAVPHRRVLRMGWISQFLSKAVITGFLFGAAIDVVVGELPKLTGTDADGENTWRQFGSGSDHRRPRRTTLVVGLISLVVVVALHVLAPKVPGALVLVIGGLLASNLLDLAGRGVATVGEVPRGLPLPALPSADAGAGPRWRRSATAAVALFLIGFSQTAGDARAVRGSSPLRDPSRSGDGGAGHVQRDAGVFQGMPVSTSLSASSLNDSSGARTPMASVVTGVAVVLTLLVLAPLFSELPKPVLAAIIIDAVVFGMMDVPEMRRLWRVKRIDFWIAVAAIVGVLSAGVLAGVVIGMALSVGWLVYVNSLPAMTELGREPGTTAFRPLQEHPDGRDVPGLLVVRFDGGLTFVTADGLVEGIRQRCRLGSASHRSRRRLRRRELRGLPGSRRTPPPRRARRPGWDRPSGSPACAPTSWRCCAADGFVDDLGERPLPRQPRSGRRRRAGRPCCGHGCDPVTVMSRPDRCPPPNGPVPAARQFP